MRIKFGWKTTCVLVMQRILEIQQSDETGPDQFPGAYNVVMQLRFIIVS